MTRKRKIKVIRELPPDFKEVKEGREEESEEKEKKSLTGEEEGLEEQVEFSGEGNEDIDFSVSKAPVLEASPVSQGPVNLEEEVESAPITTPTATEETEETPYTTSYETGYTEETTTQTPTAPTIRTEMQERGFFVRQEEIGEVKPRVPITPTRELRERNREREERREMVMQAERREEERKLPFERKYKARRRI